MAACPSCGTENPGGFNFCGKCGASLAGPQSIAEERKVVTTLFCDLVAFTAMSEGTDPEDVDAVLRSYHVATRKVIESHGGTVEKFIGDAVVGVFGVPTAHEDDPERAVRAGLRILEVLEGMTRPDGSPLQARVGINTGEALVRLDVDPASGLGFLTGDAVNTAARLEAAAPPDGVVVGALTREHTTRAIVYQELAPIAAKGKSEPVGAWRALAPVSRRGIDVEAGDLSPFVGRESELGYLSSLFDKSVAQATPQFILLVGEPGIGKSRLVRQLLAHVDELPSMTAWRQGYCPPFGEDMTYWALAEIVKGHAGIRDTDDADVVDAKLELAVPPGPDREWIRQRLRALVGLPVPEASRDENFTAWMRFFEELAVTRPTILVFEDLHWGDAALLAFIEHLATVVAAVPLTVLCTTRPELFERQPGFAAGGRFHRVNVEPLSTRETGQLVASLVGESDDDAVVNRVVDCCDGNPFYAEQSARLLSDVAAKAPLPSSVQAVLAARLDTLPREQKALLADAAVVGAVFWDGALTALDGGDAEEVEVLLRGLLMHRLVRRIRESSMEGENEYAFVHVLAREVAYQQLPRTVRARKHKAAAEWLESRSARGSGDFAALRSYHLVQALELAKAAGQQGLYETLLDAALAALYEAGERAETLDVAAAERDFRKGLDLVGDNDVERGRFLAKWAMVIADSGRYPEALPALEDGAVLLRCAGDRPRAAQALFMLGMSKLDMGMQSGRQHIAEALQLLEGVEPCHETVTVLANSSLLEADLGDPGLALVYAERALRHATQLGFSRGTGDSAGLALFLLALMSAGAARCHLDVPGGLDEMAEAADLCRSRGGYPLPILNHACTVNATMGPRDALPLYAEGVELLQARGLHRLRTRMQANALVAQWQLGLWDEFLAGVGSALAELDAVGDAAASTYLRAVMVIMQSSRGEADVAETTGVDLLVIARECDDDALLLDALVAELSITTDAATASVHLKELVGLRGQGTVFNVMDVYPHAMRCAQRWGSASSIEGLTQANRFTFPMHSCVRAYGETLLVESRQEYSDACAGFAASAVRWREFGMPYEEAQALLGHGRCLVALGCAGEAATPLGVAREIFERLGAKPALAEMERLLM